MYKAQKILISLLLLASFASCSSSNSSESQKETLTAQKNHLIDEISDLAVTLSKEAPDKNLTEKEIAKGTKLALSGLCGALENRESATVDADLLAKLDTGLPVAILLPVALGNAELLPKEALKDLLSLGSKSEQRIDTTYELYNKMHCLFKVMKQIRELT